MDWRWLDSAQHISDDEQSLESASGDAPYILNGDDFGVDICWIVGDVPIADISLFACDETNQEREERLERIRSVPKDQLYRPILELRPGPEIKLIDGGHRIEVAKERGQQTVSALVKCCAETLASLQEEGALNLPNRGTKPCL